MSLVSEVRTELSEASARFWTDQQVYDALNEAQVCLRADHPRLVETSTGLVLPEGVDIVTVPASIMVPTYIYNTSTQYTFVTQADLEEYSSTWFNVAVGQPKYFVLWQHDLIRVWPRADARYDYTIVGLPWPTEIDSGTTDLPLSHELRLALVYYATATLFIATRPQLSQQYYRMHDAAIADAKRLARRAHSHNIRRLRPASSLGAAQRGSVEAVPKYI